MLGDFVQTNAARKNGDRYQPLAMSDVGFWKDIAADMSAQVRAQSYPPPLSEQFPVLPTVGSSTSLARICSRPLMRHQLAEIRFKSQPPTTQGGDDAEVVSSGAMSIRDVASLTHTYPASHTHTHTCRHTSIHRHTHSHTPHTHAPNVPRTPDLPISTAVDLSNTAFPNHVAKYVVDVLVPID